MIAETCAYDRTSHTVVRAPVYVLGDIEDRLRAAHASHLGHPYNLVGRSPVPAQFAGYLISNEGDPYAASHHGAEVCDLERDAIRWLMDVWQCDGYDDFWGAIGASGTEANLWALYLAREALPDAVLIHSDAAHKSIPEAARMLRIPAEVVESDASGAISVAAFRARLKTLRTTNVIVALTSGTTVKGAHDDIGTVIAALDNAGFGSDRRFVHVDGALSAMVLPFLPDVPQTLQPSFAHAIDSISTSGHTMIGTPMPCGALVARRSRSTRAAMPTLLHRNSDAGVMGSRNGYAVMAMWSRLTFHGIEGFRRDARRSQERAERAAAAMRSAGVPVLLNPHSLTLVFPKPDDEIVEEYQLACAKYDAHAVIMPSVADALIARFLYDYFEWWERENKA